MFAVVVEERLRPLHRVVDCTHLPQHRAPDIEPLVQGAHFLVPASRPHCFCAPVEGCVLLQHVQAVLPDVVFRFYDVGEVRHARGLRDLVSLGVPVEYIAGAIVQVAGDSIPDGSLQVYRRG
ncbi:MAG: hypothetical protein EAX81_03940 [Candidatus Thorarchaeota archaeon]|nr:hypothetical protein [Candidatus Thorarchaeota archaeon]